MDLICGQWEASVFSVYWRNIVRFVFSKIILATLWRMDGKETLLATERTVSGILYLFSERWLEYELMEIEIEEQLW